MTTLKLSEKIKKMQSKYLNDFSLTTKEELILAKKICELKSELSQQLLKEGKIKSLVKSPYDNGFYTTRVMG